MNLDTIEIKKLKTPILSAVRYNDLFREITADSYVTAFYIVNEVRCLGLTFENIDDGTVSRLKKFCGKAMLDVIFVNVPWKENATVAFIRKGENWNPAHLKKVSRSDIFE